MEEEHITQGSTVVESRVRKNITVPEDMFDAFMELKREGETQAGLVQRVVDSMRDFDQLKSDYAARVLEHDSLRDRITELEEETDELRSGSSTAVIPGQQTFSIKDAVDSLRGICDDDAVCLKFAAKMLETQAVAANKLRDIEYNAEQKRLDREDKEKDRALKKELAESKSMHDKDMTMIKKGMIKESDLDDIVFLGQKNTSPADRINNAKELAARQAANEEEEFGDVDPPGVE